MPLPVFVPLLTLAVQTGIWFSGQFESYIHLARLACSSAVQRASALNCTLSAICTVRVTKGTTSSGARKIFRFHVLFFGRVPASLYNRRKVRYYFWLLKKIFEHCDSAKWATFCGTFPGVRPEDFSIAAAFLQVVCMTAELCFRKEQTTFWLVATIIYLDIIPT